MPKAWEVEDLKRDMPLPVGAALILRTKLPEVLHYERAARKGKVSGIHDMRVACKRLREPVRVLRDALPADRRKQILKQVEALNDRLGMVRDRDVVGRAIAKLQKTVPLARSLRKLEKQLAKERKKHFRRFLSFLDDLHDSGFVEFYENTMVHMHDDAMPPGTPKIGEFARQAVESRLDDVMDNMQAALAPWDEEPFHRQRIRVKKLKYALEPVMTVMPVGVEAVYDHISELQEIMGEIHDRDVQTAVIRQWLGNRREKPGISTVLGNLADERRGLCCEMMAHLEKMQDEQFDTRLRSLLSDL